MPFETTIQNPKPNKIKGSISFKEREREISFTHFII
jgi:hypothetical protein